MTDPYTPADVDPNGDEANRPTTDDPTTENENEPARRPEDDG